MECDDDYMIVNDYECVRYYRSGKLHSIGSPAVIWSDGRTEWWEYGVRLDTSADSGVNQDATDVTLVKN
jgi:hypothetical protein